MANTDSLLGQQLANYRLDKLIGRGGMAKVYLGWDVRLHRSVAVKVIAERYQDDLGYKERFLREARTMATWQHPNIPLVYHVGEADGVLFFAMEYIRGQNLAVMLRQSQQRGERVPYPEVLRIGWSLARALDYAHRKGVVHRDVTPANVILAEDGRVVLMDFGLALDTLEGTQGVVFGTPHYIAPEQARSSAMAVRQSDLYSLGVILYELLAGAPPFDDPSPIALALKHLSEEPLPPGQLNPELGAEVEGVLLKALRKAPAERYQSGAELMQALEDAYQQEWIESQPVTLPELPGSAAEHPPATLAQVEATGSEVAVEEPGAVTQPEGASRPAARPRSYLVLGGLGCGLLVLLTLGLLLGGISLAANLLNRPTRTPRANVFLQSTPTPTQTQTQTHSITPTPSATRITSTRSVTPSPTATPVVYRLFLDSYKDDSLFLVNEGSNDFPLELLEFKNKKGEVSGEEWKVEYLESGECVAVWKKEGNPRSPQGLDCDEVGERMERSGGDKFWSDRFDVYFRGTKIGTCNMNGNTCSIEITIKR